MIHRTTRLRLRRKFRHSKRQVEDLGLQAEEHLDRHFFRRLNRLVGVRRFVIGWVLLMVFIIAGTVVQTRALTSFYQTTKAVPGGTYSEGILGTFTNANPIYAQSGVDSAVSRLVFASLLKYNQKNQLVSDMAADWRADERGIVWTVKLKDNLHWHDGQKVTADDIVYTIQTIQNPDARSPYFSNWQNIKVTKVNTTTVKFTLSNSLASFPQSLTIGIVPQHILSKIPVSELRSARFNTASPVGAGPFKWETIEVNGSTPETREERVGMVANESYHFGQPKLDHVIIRAFHNEKNLTTSFKNQQLNAITGVDSLSDDVAVGSDVEEYSVPLTSEAMVFFKNSNDILNDIRVRQALLQAVDQSAIVKSLGYPVAVAKSPLLPTHVGYDKTITQLPYDVAAANKLLDAAGWPAGSNGLRSKAGRPLSFHLYSQSTSEYAGVTQKLQSFWRKVGVDAQVSLQADADLQTTVAQHNYDVLLYGISLGIDPDVFAFWHSSQADPRLTTRLNLSEYKSPTADKSLEAGRTRLDPTLRAIKYKPFLASWRQDAPAMALYQPRFYFVSHGSIHGFNPISVNTAADRYNNIHNWMIKIVKTSD